MRSSTKSGVLVSVITIICFIFLWSDLTSQLFQYLVQNFNANSKNNRTEGNSDTNLTTENDIIKNAVISTTLSNPSAYIKSLVSKSNNDEKNNTNKTIIIPDTAKLDNLFPSTWTLGHISMKYLMNNDICNSSHRPSYKIPGNQSNQSTSSNEIFAVILIRSYAANKGLRNKIREALPGSKLDKLGMRRVFVLAQPPKYTIDWEAKSMVSMAEVEEENKQHKDIVMGDFTDTFINSTYKHLMTLQWALRYCSDAKYMIHLEDDLVADFYQLKFKLDKNLRKKLKENFMKIDTDLIGQEEIGTFIDERKALFVLGYLNEGLLPPQNSSRIWVNWMRMRKEFPSQYKFPNHVLGGAYITNMRTAKAIISVSEKLPFYFMDDIHVTGSLREGATNKIPIPIFNIHERYAFNATHLAHCIHSPSPQYWCPFYFGHGYTSLRVMTTFYQHAEFCYRRQSCQDRMVSFDPST